MARPPTLTRNASALRQRPRIKCPRPGAAQASTATPSPTKLKCAPRDRDFATTALGTSGTTGASGVVGAAGTIISEAGISFKICLSQQRNDFFLDGARHARFILVNVHIDFRAYAKFGHVNSRFD